MDKFKFINFSDSLVRMFLNTRIMHYVSGTGSVPVFRLTLPKQLSLHVLE
jgi:hypothetical protein